MKPYKYVIIGGGLAGGRAGDGIRKVDMEGAIALVTGEHHMPYERPPLSKGYLTGKEGLDHVYLKENAYYAALLRHRLRTTLRSSRACARPKWIPPRAA
jgi:NADPH-dependent 2,4-dienoyl-CoA reductase/sulfur reductase-like enzyme